MKIILNRVLCIFLSFILGFGLGHMLYVFFGFLMIEKIHVSNITDTNNKIDYHSEDLKIDYTNLDNSR